MNKKESIFNKFLRVYLLTGLNIIALTGLIKLIKFCFACFGWAV